MPFRNNNYDRCPRCGDIALNESHRFGVRRHHCRDCYGVWLDWKEALRQFEAHGLSDSLRVFEVVKTTSELHCPSGECNRTMQRLLVHGKVELDFCVNHGFWFDRGELSKTLSAVKEAKATAALSEFDPIEQLRDLLRLSHDADSRWPALLSQILAALVKEEEPSHQTFSLVDELLKEFGEHDLANRLYREIDENRPWQAVADLYSILIWSTSDNGDALSASTDEWIRHSSSTRQVRIALSLEVLPFATTLEMEKVLGTVRDKFPDLAPLCNKLILSRRKQH